MQSLENGTELGAYTIVRLIGRGGMGEVYEAFEQRLQRRVAIKVISPQKAGEKGEVDLVRRFLQEARTLAQVNHPNVVTIYAIDRIGDVQFIAMEYVDGALLKDLFTVYALSADEATPMFLQMLEGLRSLHENKIVHRDIKPHNLILRPNGQIKILDFGIAKREGDSDNEKTTVGVVIGTLSYLPPEVLRGRPASARSDLWSLGAIFYECLVGQPLVSLHNIKIKGVRAVEASEVIFPEETLNWIPEDMRKIIGRMCEKDPEQRYQTANMVIEDLKRYQQSRPLVAPSVFSSLAKSVARIADLKTQLDPKSSNDPKAKRALALAQITGAATISTDTGKVAEVVKVETQEVRDSVTSRRRSRKRRGHATSNPWIQVSAVLGVVAVMATVFVRLAIRRDEDARAAAARTATINLMAPFDKQNLWIEAGQSPVFTWSNDLNPGDYELQIGSESETVSIISSEPVHGRSYKPARTLPEGKYQWRLVPVRSQLQVSTINHFSVSYLTPVELVTPEPLHAFEPPSAGQIREVNLGWKCKAGASQYRVQIFTEDGSNLPARDLVVPSCQLEHVILPAGNFSWMVRVEEPVIGRAAWSERRKFALLSPPPAVVEETPAARPVVHRLGFEAMQPQLLNTKVSTTLHFVGVVPQRDVASAHKQMLASPLLKWAPLKEAHSYELQIGEGSDFKHLVMEDKVEDAEYDWRKAIPGHFVWRVRALSNSGAASKYSTRGKIEVRLPAPTVKSVGAKTFAWTEVPLAEKYSVQSSPTRNMASVSEAVTAQTEIKLDPMAKTALYMRVAAADSNGQPVSDYSQVVNIQPESSLPPGPELKTPPQGAHPRVGGSGRISVLFSWMKIPSATQYTVEIASDSGFTQLLDSQTTRMHGYILKEAQLTGFVYWRVRAILPNGPTDWSQTRFFEVRESGQTPH